MIEFCLLIFAVCLIYEIWDMMFPSEDEYRKNGNKTDGEERVIDITERFDSEEIRKGS